MNESDIMTLKIFHTADLHIGKGYTRFDDNPKVQDDLRKRRYEVLEDMVEKANQNNCDLFVIAGDLFDGPRFKKGDDVDEIKPYLKGFEGKQVLILPGNHDYYSESNKDRWGWVDEIERVKVLKKPETYDLAGRLEERTAVYPAPCNSKTSSENRIDWIKENQKDDETDHHIGLAHGHLEGCSYDDEGKYFPMSKEDLEGSELDLWLMGHVHVMIPQSGSTLENYYFPGTPEQDGFKKLAEESKKGKALIIELDEDGVTSNRIDVGKYTFNHEDFEIVNMDDFKEMKDYLEDGGNENILLKLKITGKMNMDDFEEVQGYINDLRDDPKGFKYIEVNDGDFARRIDMNVVKNEFSEGAFPYRLMKNVLEEDDELSDKAAELAYEKIEEMRE